MMLAVSRRGLSLATGLIFGMPVVIFFVAAVFFSTRFEQVLAGAASFAVFLLSVAGIGLVVRRMPGVVAWLHFEMTMLVPHVSAVCDAGYQTGRTD